jgi:hypothetical protein
MEGAETGYHPLPHQLVCHKILFMWEGICKGKQIVYQIQSKYKIKMLVFALFHRNPREFFSYLHPENLVELLKVKFVHVHVHV